MTKKKDLFLEKFEQNIRFYPKKREFEFARGMKTIGKIIGNSISDREYGKLSQKTEKEFLKALEICKEYELDCDAVHNLEKHVFEGNNSSINTKDCPKWEDFKMEMREYLNKLPDRGFVYIAWRAANTFNVYYIGMTEISGGDRILELSKNVSLSRAIEKGATKLTIIFTDNKNNIKSVEGSLIRIINKLGYKMLNIKKEHFDNYDGEIDELEKLLKKIIDKVKASIKN